MFSAKFRGGWERKSLVQKLVHATMNHNSRLVKARIQVREVNKDSFSGSPKTLRHGSISFLDLCYSFFTLPLPLAGSIESEMQCMHSWFRGDVFVAHVRDQYRIKEKGDLSRVFPIPGGCRAVLVWKKEKAAVYSLRRVTCMEEKDPVHLDTVWPRVVSPEYSTFRLGSITQSL